VHSIGQDVRFALRSFSRTAAATLLSIATLALGIGANAAIFTVVHRVLIAPLPYPAADRVVVPWRHNAQMGGLSVSPSLNDLRKWQSLPSVEALTMYSGGYKTIVGGEEPRTVYVQQIEPQLLDFTGTQPQLGRPFTREDAASEAAARVILLTDRTWRRDFDADRQVVGRRIQLSDETYEIVGVLPASFRLPRARTDMVSPLPPPPPPKQGQVQHIIVSAMIRLKPGVTRDAATAELIAAGVEALGGSQAGWTVRLLEAADTTGETFKRALLVLFGAVGFVLLIACANVASIALARNASREREIAVRVALGAGRGRLVRQLLTENILIAVAGGALGIGFGIWGLQAISALRPPDMTELADLPINREMVAFSFVLSVVTGLAFGLLPAISGTRGKPTDGLRHGSRAHGSRRGQLARRTLSVVEVALALVLLAGAGLLLKSYSRLLAANLGFNPERVLAIDVTLPEERYQTPAECNQFFTQMMDLVRPVEGVRSVALAMGGPPRGGMIFGQLETRDGKAKPGLRPTAFGGGWVSPGYFEVLGIPVRDGRTFTPDDLRNSERVAIVNETFARQHWPGETTVGRQIRMDAKSPWATIIGVVGDVKITANDSGRVQIYMPATRSSIFNDMTVLVATTGEPESLIAAIKTQVWSIDSKLPLRDIQSVETRVAETLARPRYNLVLLSCFAGLGLVLASIGIYGVISFGVGMRTQEIGIRMALGAVPSDIRRAVLGEAFTLAGMGAAVGLAGAFALSRLMSTLLYETSASDPWTFATTAAVLALSALLAAWLPARRAMRVDPMVAMRVE
jgi:putative ABC transport system permease protein